MTETSNIFEVIDRFRRELLQREISAARALVRAYGEVWKRIKEDLERLHVEYVAMKARGESPGPDWVYQYNRARVFRDQVERELLTFAQYAEATVREEQREAIVAAERRAEELVRRILTPVPEGIVILWNQIDRRSVEVLLGMTQADSPLHQLFTRIAVDGAQKAEDSLVQGMLLGQSPRDVAVAVRQALGVTLRRALTIARTETLRAHREATRESYQANSDIVRGWIWHSALDARTCAACWAMHGTRHSVDAILDDHPNGRCAMVPVTASWAEIGKQFGLDLSNYPDPNPTIEPGTTLFEALPQEMQISILGQKKWEAWKNGAFTLSDVVGRADSREWGTHRYERSLQDILETAARHGTFSSGG